MITDPESSATPELHAALKALRLDPAARSGISDAARERARRRYRGDNPARGDRPGPGGGRRCRCRHRRQHDGDAAEAPSTTASQEKPAPRVIGGLIPPLQASPVTVCARRSRRGVAQDRLDLLLRGGDVENLLRRTGPVIANPTAAAPIRTATPLPLLPTSNAWDGARWARPEGVSSRGGGPPAVAGSALGPRSWPGSVTVDGLPPRHLLRRRRGRWMGRRRRVCRRGGCPAGGR